MSSERVLQNNLFIVLNLSDNLKISTRTLKKQEDDALLTCGSFFLNLGLGVS